MWSKALDCPPYRDEMGWVGKCCNVRHSSCLLPRQATRRRASLRELSQTVEKVATESGAAAVESLFDVGGQDCDDSEGMPGDEPAGFNVSAAEVCSVTNDHARIMPPLESCECMQAHGEPQRHAAWGAHVDMRLLILPDDL